MNIDKAMNYRSVGDMNEVILRGLDQIPFDVDLIVGVPRSGLLAATLISLYLNRPLTDLEGLREGRFLGKGKRPIPGYRAKDVADCRRILVVDDCVSKGDALRKAKAVVDDIGLSDKSIFLTVFSFPENPNLADITLQVIPRPMCFQWSFMHTPELKNYCLDIDGVICRDATKHEDDDGPNYLRFLEDASPLFVPTAEVGWLVTSRLERYRAETEAWLDRHGVRYRELIMMDLPSKAVREASGMHVKYKADAYRSSGAQLFIESSPVLARKIQEQAGLPVLCMTSNQVIGNPELEWYLIRQRQIKNAMRWMTRIPRALGRRMRALGASS